MCIEVDRVVLDRVWYGVIMEGMRKGMVEMGIKERGEFGVWVVYDNGL